MALIHRYYKCDECGNVVLVVVAGDAELECCGTRVKILEEEDLKIGYPNLPRPDFPKPGSP